MKNVFRKSALDKIASVDQLDKALKITSPFSWLALLGVTLIVVATLIWATITGTLPYTVTTNFGMIVKADTATNTIKAGCTGTVQWITQPGPNQFLHVDEQNPDQSTIVAEIRTNSGETVPIFSNQIGYVAQTLVKESDQTDPQTELIRIRPYMTSGQEHAVVCYVSVNDVGKITRDKTVYVFLSSADGSNYGHMEGRVVNVDRSATSADSIEAVVGKGNETASSFMKNGPVCAVTCELIPCSSDHPTKSGYWWSNEKGEQYPLNAPEMCSVKIIIREEKPITKFISMLKDIWENKR